MEHKTTDEDTHDREYADTRAEEPRETEIQQVHELGAEAPDSETNQHDAAATQAFANQRIVGNFQDSSLVPEEPGAAGAGGGTGGGGGPRSEPPTLLPGLVGD